MKVRKSNISATGILEIRLLGLSSVESLGDRRAPVPAFNYFQDEANLVIIT